MFIVVAREIWLITSKKEKKKFAFQGFDQW